MGSIGGSLALWLLVGFVYWEAPAEDWREGRERLGHVSAGPLLLVTVGWLLGVTAPVRRTSPYDSFSSGSTSVPFLPFQA